MELKSSLLLRSVLPFAQGSAHLQMGHLLYMESHSVTRLECSTTISAHHNLRLPGSIMETEKSKVKGLHLVRPLLLMGTLQMSPDSAGHYVQSAVENLGMFSSDKALYLQKLLPERGPDPDPNRGSWILRKKEFRASPQCKAKASLLRK
ncbi:hypothetical protein AAY473_000315 [Plecturocebus cupreus]